MRFTPTMLLIAATACAGGSTTLSRTGSEMTTAGTRIVRNDVAKVSALPFPLARVWQALPFAYDSLAIPLTDLDQAKHRVGNEGMKVHKTLGKVDLSKYIDCGATQGFPSADTYDIHLSVITEAKASDNGGTIISTLVQASGRPMAFPGSYTTCSTKETLENRIVELVTKRLAR
jgi:hypothetical protein